MALYTVLLVLLALSLFLFGMYFGQYRSCRKASREMLQQKKNTQAEIDNLRQINTAILQNSFSGFAFHELARNPDGKPVDVIYLEANDRFFELWGLPKEILGKGMREVLPFYREEWLPEYDEVIRTGKSVHRRAYIAVIDVYLDICIFRVSDKVFGALFHDITQLVQSEQQLKNAIANINGIFFSMNKNGIFTLAEGLALSKFNPDSREIVGISAFEYFKDRPDILVSLHSCLSGELVETVHLINGTYLETRYTPVKDNNNNVVGLLGVAVDITQQTLAREEFLKNESKYRNVFENMQSGFTMSEILFDDGGNPSDIRLQYANKRFKEMYGLSRQEIAGKTFSEIFPAYEPEMAVKAFQVVSTGKSYTRVSNTNNPEQKFIESTIFKADANQIIGIDTDLTGLFSAESELQSSRKKFLEIFNLVPDPALIVRAADRTFVDCNLAFARFTGLGQDDYSGKTVDKIGYLVNPDDIQRIVERVSKEEMLQGYTLSATSPEGRHYDFSVSARHISYANEPCYLILAHDITREASEKTTAEKSVISADKSSETVVNITFNDLFDIAEIQALQDAFANAAGVASLITTPEGVAITKPSNFTQFCKIIRDTELGCRNCMISDRIIGEYSPMGPLIQPCLSGGLWDAGASIGVNGKHLASWLIGQVRNEVQDVDNMRKYAAQIGLNVGDFLAAFEEVPVMSEDRFRTIAQSLYILAQHLSKQAYQLVLRESYIRERSQLEQQIVEMNASLEKKITERTEQLQQAIKDQEALAYSISHDLRSPLRHIDGFLKLMMNRINTQDDTIRGYFDRITQAYHRMTAMIDDLLIYSRIGRKDLDLREVDLNILVNEVVDQFKDTSGDRDVEWKISLLPVVECDRNLFRTVFENLISNALKYTARKPKAVIEIGARDLPDRMTEIFIRDNGIGFSMTYAHRLFGVFQRLHHNEDYAGTGIGLANVKQVVARHMGKVRAEGVLNEGATFYLTLHHK